MTVQRLQPGPALDERGIVRWHDVDLMARLAINAMDREDHIVAGMAILLPGVLDRVLEVTKPPLSATTLPGHE